MVIQWGHHWIYGVVPPALDMLNALAAVTAAHRNWNCHAHTIKKISQDNRKMIQIHYECIFSAGAVTAPIVASRIHKTMLLLSLGYTLARRAQFSEAIRSRFNLSLTGSMPKGCTRWLRSGRPPTGRLLSYASIFSPRVLIRCLVDRKFCDHCVESRSLALLAAQKLPC